MAPKHTHKKYSKEIKTPRNYGVEVECLRGKGSRADVTTLSFDSVEDGSLPRNGEEKRSDILCGDKGLEAIEVLSNRLKEHKYTVNNKCGLHVHVDATGMTGKQVWNVANFIQAFDDVIFSMMPECRRRNRYCKKYIPDPTQFKQLKRLSEPHLYERFSQKGDRYFGFNTAALEKHGTLEFRYHAGTIDSKKIINWVKICVSIVEIWHDRELHLKQRVKPTRNNVVKFCKLLQLDEVLTDYVISRWSKNNISKNNTEIAIERVMKRRAVRVAPTLN